MVATDEQILAFVREYTSKNGYPPTMREIGNAVGITAASSVQYRLRRLKMKGLVQYDHKKPRTLRVVER